jgi:hypothetical protein
MDRTLPCFLALGLLNKPFKIGIAKNGLNATARQFLPRQYPLFPRKTARAGPSPGPLAEVA